MSRAKKQAADGPAVSLDEMISSLESQAASLKELKAKLLTAVDGAVLKDVVAHLTATAKAGKLRLYIRCGTQDKTPEIEWRIWDGSEWDYDKGKPAPTLAEAYRLFACKGREDADLDSVSQELTGGVTAPAEEIDKAEVAMAKGALLQTADAKAGADKE